MTDFSSESLATIGPKEFAQLVKSTPDSKIAEVMSGDDRGKILDEVFNRMPTLFRADRAGATQAVIHWIITGGAGGGTRHLRDGDRGRRLHRHQPAGPRARSSP